MSDGDSDGFSEFSFTFTEQDLANLDANVASILNKRPSCDIDAPPDLKNLDGISSQADILQLDNSEGTAANSSFASDTFDLNLGALSAEELAILDAKSSRQDLKTPSAGPSIEIEIEDSSSSETEGASKGSDPTLNLPPISQFRSHVPLSVTDLCAPSWCEVQYDYGLRGRRSRPLAHRPKSFVSASGKKISPAVNIAAKNDVTTKQGLAIHKELEREVKFEELRVEITTDETRWALRLVNMIGCLRGILDGFTREMPVFGLLHGEVVVGIMDEVVKTETQPTAHCSSNSQQAKRSLTFAGSSTSPKRQKAEIPTSQTFIDRFFDSPKKSCGLNDSVRQERHTPPEKPILYTLFIKDNKTRKNGYMPSGTDMYSGQIQLMIYRRLLSELLSTDPPYDFKPLWHKLDLNSSEIFPTQFLLQAHLVEESDDLKSSCLDDLVEQWHRLVKDSNIAGVSPLLELVYRLRPPPDIKQKRKAVSAPESEVITGEDKELAAAIAASLSDVHTADESTTAGPSTTSLEDTQLQWALQQSQLPQSATAGSSGLSDSIETAFLDVVEAKTIPDMTKKEDGIRLFKIIGTKQLYHNDRELDAYLTHVLMWWHGERRPEGVDLEHSYRCSTCEYADDCEWRSEKALEYSRKKKK